MTSILRLPFKSDSRFKFLGGDIGVRRGGSNLSSFLSVGGKGVFGCKWAGFREERGRERGGGREGGRGGGRGEMEGQRRDGMRGKLGEG